jgi:hypothetical protein
VVKGGSGGKGGEMTQTLYVHINKKRKENGQKNRYKQFPVVKIQMFLSKCTKVHS